MPWTGYAVDSKASIHFLPCDYGSAGLFLFLFGGFDHAQMELVLHSDV